MTRAPEREVQSPMRQPARRRAARRAAFGSVAALASMTLFTAAMVPLRGHLSIAIAALILVVPVVVGVATGGFLAGVVSVAVGFLTYNYFFIPPYGTLQVGAAENWAVLVVYAVVMIPVARVVANMITARAEAQQRGVQLRRLLDVSSRLIEDRPVDELLRTVVEALRDIVDARQVTLLMPRDGTLEIAAGAGEPLTARDRADIRPLAGQITSSVAASGAGGGVERGAGDGIASGAGNVARPIELALVASGRPVGLLAISGVTITDEQREPLRLFANQAALAIERAQLREQALHTQLADEVARVARTLVAAASHDLRSPLASIKAASSVLADPQLDTELEPAQRAELVTLIDTQADRLAELVANLLDMGRVQAGVLQPRTEPLAVADLVTAAADPRRLPPPTLDLSASLPPVQVDPVLITRVLANLLDNAYRHSPAGSPVTISATESAPGTVTVCVTDRGPGVNPDRRGEIFGFYVRRSGGGTGLGLAIAKTFIDAHHQRIWVESGPAGGARFCFTLPAVIPTPLAA